MEAMCVKCHKKCKEGDNKRSRMVYCSEAPEGMRVFHHLFSSEVNVPSPVAEKAVRLQKAHKVRATRKVEADDPEID